MCGIIWGWLLALLTKCELEAGGGCGDGGLDPGDLKLQADDLGELFGEGGGVSDQGEGLEAVLEVHLGGADVGGAALTEELPAELRIGAGAAPGPGRLKRNRRCLNVRGIYLHGGRRKQA